MRVDVLSRLQDIWDACTMRHPACSTHRHILSHAIHRALSRTCIVQIGQGCRRVICLQLTAQTRKLLLHRIQEPFCPFLLEGLIVCPTPSDGCTTPLFNILHLHIGENHACLGIGRLRLMTEVHIEIAFGPTLVVVVLTAPGGIACIAEEIGVHIGSGLVLEMQVDREDARCLWHGIDTLSEGRPYQVAVEHFKCPDRMGIRNHHICWNDF